MGLFFGSALFELRWDPARGAVFWLKSTIARRKHLIGHFSPSKSKFSKYWSKWVSVCQKWVLFGQKWPNLGSYWSNS